MLLVSLLELFNLIDCDRCIFLFFSYSIVGRIKDTFKTPAGRQVSPYQIEDALLSDPQGLLADAVVAGVTPSLRSKDERGKAPRAWIVLSDEGKKLGVEAVIKKVEAWYQKALSDHKWLYGGIEIVDEVCMAVVFKQAYSMIQIFDLDSQVDIGQAIKSSIAKEI